MLKNQGLDTTALIPHSMKVYTILNKGEGPHPDLKIFVNSPFSTCHSFKTVTVLKGSCCPVLWFSIVVSHFFFQTKI